jgi:hypothetical protein
MTTLAAQLRAIADRIEARDAAIGILIEELEDLAMDAGKDITTRIIRGESIYEPDSASVTATDEERVPGEGAVEAPAVVSPSAPIEKPGRGQPVRAPAADGQTAPVIDAWQRPYRVKTLQCPECEFRALDAAGLGSHRRHRHGVAGTTRGAKDWAKKHPPSVVPTTNGAPEPVLREHAAPIREQGEPTERRWPARPTIAERVAARDAGRTRRQGRSVGGGLRRVNVKRSAA